MKSVKNQVRDKIWADLNQYFGYGWNSVSNNIVCPVWDIVKGKFILSVIKNVNKPR